jgi:HlyD family secretion protein
MMSSRLRFAVAFGLLVAIGLGAIYWYRTREIAVDIAHPQNKVEVRVFGIGTVEAQVVSRVGFQVAGKVNALAADQGDFVKAGTVLAKLDADAQRARLMKSDAAMRQSAANLLRVQAQRDRAEVSYQQKKSVNARRQSLVGRGAVSQEAAEDAQAAEDIARSDLKLVEADVSVATVLQDDAAAQRRIDSVLLDQHELRAPYDARVVARHKELGAVANAGEAVFTLIEPDSVWIRTYIDESSAGGLEVGQTAFVRLRSEATHSFEAEVVRIDQENDRVTEERRVYVRCRQCGPQHQFRFLGEQAEIEIVKKVVPAGLFVPLKFVEGYDGRSGNVWLIDNGRLARRKLQLGDRLLDGRVQVLSELPPGTSIVLDSGSRLRDGRAARPLAAPDAQGS